MTKYDEPGHVDILPGIGPFNRPDTTPGSTGVAAETTAGPVVGTSVVSNPYASSQVAINMPTVPVHSGDTSGFSDDQPVHSSPIMPGSAEAMSETGAGQGHAGHHPHPNSLGTGA